ncbi:MAG: hypothetical protein AAGJ32_02140 [Pseudomonadota bacterium]
MWPYQIDWVATAACAALVISVINLILLTSRAASEATAQWLSEYRSLASEVLFVVQQMNDFRWLRDRDAAGRNDFGNADAFLEAQKQAKRLSVAVRLFLDPKNGLHRRFNAELSYAFSPYTEDAANMNYNEYAELADMAVQKLESTVLTIVQSTQHRMKLQRMGVFWL